METGKHKRYLFLGIVLSLLINLCMIIFIGLSKYNQSALSQAVELKIAKKKKEQAKKKRAQDLKFPQRYKQKTMLTPGSPVWFKNNAPAVLQKAPDHGVNNITASQKGTVQQSKPQEKIKPKDGIKKKEALSSAAKKTVHTKETKKNIALNKQKQSTSIKQKEKTKKIASNKKEVVAEAIKKEAPTKAVKNNNIQTNNIPPQTESETKKIKAPVSPAKNKKGKFSLKGLQKGFTQYLRQGNNTSVSRQGNIKGDPDIEDLKLISYYNQIRRTIDSAISAIGTVTTTRLDPSDKPVQYELIIERDGTISSYRFIQRSKHDELNQHAIKVIENLGSFPPLPSYIPDPHVFKYGFLYFPPTLEFYS